MERIQKKRRRGQRMLQRLLLFLSALIVAAGLAHRFGKSNSLQVTGVAEPTVTPIAGLYDETIETREITLPQVCWYVIQTGIYTDESAALSRADAYTDRGAPGIVIADGSKWRVFIASFSREEDAAAVRANLSGQQNVDTYLYTWPCPELRLRMTGMAGQLDVAEAGLQQGLTAAERLRDAAISLDAGEITQEEALQMIQDIEDQWSVWVETASKRFSKPYPALVSAELTLADAWTEHRRAIQQCNNATELSAALKCRAMQLFHSVVTMRTQLQSS